jgi:hypothetical protein
MHAISEATVDAINVADSRSEPSIVELFRATLKSARLQWEAPLTFELIERLWGNDAVVKAVEALQDAHCAAGDIESAQARLHTAIELEIRQPAA